jgi:hypothetical protein
MADPVFIPFQARLTPLIHSSRVHNAIYITFDASYDITKSVSHHNSGICAAGSARTASA